MSIFGMGETLIFFLLPRSTHIHTCYFLTTMQRYRQTGLRLQGTKRPIQNTLTKRRSFVGWCHREEQLHKAWFKAQTMSSGTSSSFFTSQHCFLGPGSRSSLQGDAGGPQQFWLLSPHSKSRTCVCPQSPREDLTVCLWLCITLTPGAVPVAKGLWRAGCLGHRAFA